MRTAQGNLSGFRVFMAIMLMLALFAVASSGAAQDPTPGGQPAAPSDLPPDAPLLPEPTLETLAFPVTENYSAVCQSIESFVPGQFVNEATRPIVSGDVVYSYLMDNRVEVATDLLMPTGSRVTMYGPGAWMQVMEGAVAVVSCDGEMVFDFQTGDYTQYVLPAATALIVTPEQQQGVFLALDQMPGWVWIVQIGHGTTSEIDLHLEVGQWPDQLICDQVDCLGTEDIDRQALDTNNDDETEAGGPCALVRCWSR